MADFVAGNRFLSMDEMKVNARYIYDYLGSRGWTKNAIAGMLGNMQTESTINPAIWENCDEGNTSGGYGLVQWTPATKYLDWCDSRGLSPSNMESALLRIEYEMEQGLQYYPTDAYPLTFKQFKTSTASPSYLAMAFLNNYERPADYNQPTRGTQAEFWFEYLTGEPSPDTPDTPDTPTKKKTKGLSLLMMYAATRWR